VTHGFKGEMSLRFGRLPAMRESQMARLFSHNALGTKRTASNCSNTDLMPRR
jgi:hypothetical protein